MKLSAESYSMLQCLVAQCSVVRHVVMQTVVIYPVHVWAIRVRHQRDLFKAPYKMRAVMSCELSTFLAALLFQFIATT